MDDGVLSGGLMGGTMDTSGTHLVMMYRVGRDRCLPFSI